MAGNIGPQSTRPPYISNHKRAFILTAAAIVILTGIAFAFFHMGKHSSVEADETSAATPMAGRVDQVEGNVGIAPEFNGQDQNNVDWLEATVNSPVSVGDRIYVRDSGSAGIAFGRNYARLDAGTLLDVVTLTDQRTQVALRDGSATFDCGGLRSNDFFEVETPDGAIDFKEPGLYQIGFNDNGHAVITVLSGQAEVIGQSGSTLVAKGETLTLVGSETNETSQTNQAVSSHLERSYAGSLVNDYYRYRAPKDYDGRYANYDTYLDDPFYYEPHHHSVSYKYFDDDDYIAGIDDLDTYGSWEYVEGYGDCWRPNVAADWAPYNDGYWATDYPWGLTWVSNERWGWAPYHYGRWGYVQDRWAWIPGPRENRQVYAPALVAFVPIPERQEIGWVPLGPGDHYIPRYYNNNWQAQFVAGRREVAFERTRNFNAPGAVTVVTVNNFNRRIDRSTIVRPNAAELGRARFVADPFTVPSIRERARDFSANRQRVTVPAEVQNRAFNRQVVASQAPILPPPIRNNAQAMRIERVREAQAGRRLQVDNSGQVVGTQVNPQQVQQQSQQNAIAEQQRQARIATLRNQVANGDRRSSIELRRLQQQNPNLIHAGQNPVVPVQRLPEVQQRQQQINAARQQQQQTAEQQRQAQQGQQQREQQMNAQRQAQQQQQQLQRNQQIQQERDQRNAQRQTQQQQQQIQRNQQIQQQRAAQQAARQQRQQQQQQVRTPQAQPQPRAIQPSPQQRVRPPQAQPRQQPVRPPQAQPRQQPVRPPQAQPRPQPIRPQAQPRPEPIRPPQAQPGQQPMRPSQAQPRPQQVRPPQAQPRPQQVRPPQAQPRPDNHPSAGPRKKGPGGH